MKELHTLTDLQLTLLDAVWRQEEATVREVHRAQAGTLGLALKTVGTVLRRLEHQGILEHRTEGRQFIYRVRVTREAVRDATLQAAAENLFGGSFPDLVVHALEEGALDPNERDRVRQALEGLDGAAPVDH